MPPGIACHFRIMALGGTALQLHTIQPQGQNFNVEIHAIVGGIALGHPDA